MAKGKDGKDAKKEAPMTTEQENFEMLQKWLEERQERQGKHILGFFVVMIFLVACVMAYVFNVKGRVFIKITEVEDRINDYSRELQAANDMGHSLEGIYRRMDRQDSETKDKLRVLTDAAGANSIKVDKLREDFSTLQSTQLKALEKLTNLMDQVDRLKGDLKTLRDALIKQTGKAIPLAVDKSPKKGEASAASPIQKLRNQAEQLEKAGDESRKKYNESKQIQFLAQAIQQHRRAVAVYIKLEKLYKDDKIGLESISKDKGDVQRLLNILKKQYEREKKKSPPEKADSSDKKEGASSEKSSESTSSEKEGKKESPKENPKSDK